MTKETMTIEAEEIRLVGDEGSFSGYAAIFDEPNSFGEIVAPGAFKKSLRERKASGVGLFWNHNSDKPIGTWSSIEEDKKGLKVEGQLITEIDDGQKAHLLLQRKAVTGLSIGFRTRGDKRGPNGVRIITDVDLLEISLVTLPSASKARVTSVRSIRQEDIRTFTEAVRNVTAQIRG